MSLQMNGLNENDYLDAYQIVKRQFKRKYSLESKETFSLAWICYYRYFLRGERESDLVRSMTVLIDTVRVRKPKSKTVQRVQCPHCFREFTP